MFFGNICSHLLQCQYKSKSETILSKSHWLNCSWQWSVKGKPICPLIEITVPNVAKSFRKCDTLSIQE